MIKENNKRKRDNSRYPFLCVGVSVQCICNLWQFPTRSWDSLGGLPGNYTLLSYHSVFAEPVELPTSPPTPLHSPPDTVTPPLCCWNVTPAQFFEKPFHFSLLSETCSNGLLSLHMVSSVIHIWCNICWPFLTWDSGCNYDRPNAPLNCTARLLLAALHFICPAGLTLSGPLRFNLKMTLLDVS